jgi:histidinol phosphatase-like PHP family hydrolase
MSEGTIKDIPVIGKEEVHPGKNAPEAARVRREEEKRGERPDALSQHILEWWRGDAHTHSKESTRKGWGYVEGVYDIEEAAAYYEKLGLEFVCFTEHASKPGSPERQSPDSAVSQSLIREAERIVEVNKEGKEGVSVFSGVETNIFFDNDGKPTLDLPSEVLQDLDLVVASRHAIAREKDLDAIRESLLFAIRHPDVDVIGHPDRYVRVVGDWDILRAYSPEAEDYHREMRAKQQQKKEVVSQEDQDRVEGDLQVMYATIRKAIGKDSLEPGDETNEQLTAFIEARKELEERYWPMWEEIIREMAASGKAFEINLNNPPQDRLVEMAAEAGVKFFIDYDAHDFHQYKKELTQQEKAGRGAAEAWAKGEASDEDLDLLKQYKLERLQSGPGVVAILCLARTIRRLESLGLTPERVINSSRENLLSFLVKDRGKTTKNLTQLVERSRP